MLKKLGRFLRNSLISVSIALVFLEISLHFTGWALRSFTLIRTTFTKQDLRQKDRTFKIMVLGESTSYGVLIENRTTNAFPFRLVQALSEEFSDVEFDLLNLSYPAQISDSIVRIFKNKFNKYNPDLVICQFGGNDFNLTLNPMLRLKIYQNKYLSYLAIPKTVRLITLYYLFYKEKFLLSHKDDGGFVFYDEHTGGKNTFYSSYAHHTRKNYQFVLDTLELYETPYLMLSYFDSYPAVYDFFNDISSKNDSKYINLELPDNSSDLYAEDNWHPNVKGHRFITQKILDKLLSDQDYFFAPLIE